jgi:hypothetical protein
MPIRLGSLCDDRQRARAGGPGAEADGVGRPLLGIIKLLCEARMPVGAIDGGDIDTADTSFHGQSCLGGSEQLQREQTGGFQR